MPQRVTYILSQVDKAVAFEWIVDHLDPNLVELRFILLNENHSTLESELDARGIHIERVRYRGLGDVPRALATTIRILLRWRPDTVHAHLMPAGLVGLIAATLTGVRRRVYTRHHSTFHHRYAPHWVMVDRLINSLATNIVAISRNVYDVLVGMEKVPKSKVCLIHHGFRAEEFCQVNDARVRRLRQKYDLDQAGFVVGIVARYVEWKGHESIVRAAHLVLRSHPNTTFVFANARGSESIGALVRSLPAARVREIAFEEDLFALYRLFDAHVHVPIDPQIEAFGQTYVEALLAGVPSVFTLSGVAHEFVNDRHNALVVPHCAPTLIAEAIIELIESPSLRTRLIRQGERDVGDRFALGRMIGGLAALYAGGGRGSPVEHIEKGD
jgi:glycosyltransferase involved in cell wall biosynthesis